MDMTLQERYEQSKGKKAYSDGYTGIVCGWGFPNDEGYFIMAVQKSNDEEGWDEEDINAPRNDKPVEYFIEDEHRFNVKGFWYVDEEDFI
jgi:hypothetical protein